MTAVYGQRDYQLRLEWGGEGVATLAGDCAVLVVVDVLSFSTAVSVAVDRGAAVLPLRWRDERAAAAATSAGAVLASNRRSAGEWSLSPSSLRSLPAGTRLALPSPNGATLSAAAAGAGCRVLTGCLRNATAVARAAARLAAGSAIAIVPAGERWRLDGSPLRPALEDLLGAGAVAAALVEVGAGPVSPEAMAAVEAFRAARRTGLVAAVTGCSSGRELAAEGFTTDVELAAEHDVSDSAPLLRDGLFQPAH